LKEKEFIKDYGSILDILRKIKAVQPNYPDLDRKIENTKDSFMVEVLKEAEHNLKNNDPDQALKSLSVVVHLKEGASAEVKPKIEDDVENVIKWYDMKTQSPKHAELFNSFIRQAIYLRNENLREQKK
jgi:hypothetical protein